MSWVRAVQAAQHKAEVRAPLELFEAGVAPVIIPTGGGLPGDVTTEGLAGYTYLRDRGVPEDAILPEVDADNTYEALSAAAVILEQRGLRRAVLVSDPYHNRRLEGIAREVGLDAGVSPTRIWREIVLANLVAA